jgi:hypothetical protein
MKTEGGPIPDSQGCDLLLHRRSQLGAIQSGVKPKAHSLGFRLSGLLDVTTLFSSETQEHGLSPVRNDHSCS